MSVRPRRCTRITPRPRLHARPRPRPRRARGFTLVELLLAMTLAALVLASGFAALNFLGEATARATLGVEQAIGVDRTLRTLQNDLAYAAAVTFVDADTFVIRNADGTAVAYHRDPAGTELHRLTAASQLAAILAVTTLSLTLAGPAALTAAGNLRDVDYRSSALIQGMSGIDWWFLPDAARTQTIGVKMEIRYLHDRLLRSTQAVGLLLPGVS